MVLQNDEHGNNGETESSRDTQDASDALQTTATGCADANRAPGSPSERRRSEIAALLRQRKDPPLLLELHGSYVDRYHKDQERTWSTATWLLVVAWSLFPAATAFGSSLNEQIVLVFGAVSSALVLLWSMIAWWHLAWASRSYDMVRALEMALLTDDVDLTIRDKLKKAHRGPFWLPEVWPMRILRLLIAVGTIAAWIAMRCAVSSGWFEFPPTPAT